MWTEDSPEVSRSLGWINLDEQRAKFDGRVCIAGMGGAGYLTALSLLRDGVHELNVADNDEMSRENMNRVHGATLDTIDINKAEVFLEQALTINPAAKINVFKDGVSQDNVEEFTHGVTVGFDGIDLNHPEYTVMYARRLRSIGAAMVSGMEIGPSAMVTSFHPNKGKTFEKMAGFKEDEPLDEIAQKAKEGLDLTRLVPYIPYKAADSSVLAAVMNGAPLPSNVEGTNLYASMAGHEIGLHLTQNVANNRESIIWAPNYHVVDHSRRFAGVVKGSRTNFVKYVMLMKAREQFNMNPRAGYDHVVGDNT